MKALQNKLKYNTKQLINVSSKNLNKTFRPSFYNLRLYYSNLRRNDHGYGRWDMVWAPEGFEKVKLIELRLKQIEILIILNINLMFSIIQYMSLDTFMEICYIKFGGDYIDVQILSMYMLFHQYLDHYIYYLDNICSFL